LHWQSAGDYLCVKVERKATKKTTSTGFELYRMREKDVPLEVHFPLVVRALRLS
jgi:translation initiation factor 3 subunit B